MKALLLLILGVFGLIETVTPKSVVRLWTKASYRDAKEAEPRAWLPVAVRIEGALLVLVSLVGLFRLATAEASTGEPSDAAATGE